MVALQKYLDKSLEVLEKFGIKLKEGEESRLVTLLEDVQDVDEPNVLAIAQTIKYMGTFNQMVRDNVEEIHSADRYDAITQGFNSIISDSKALVGQLENDGRIDWKEDLRNKWMKLVRGTTHERFEKIRKTYLEVQRDTKEALDREDEILNGYMDYRFAVKEAEGLSYDVLKIEEGRLEAAKNILANAQKTLDGAGDDPAEKARLQLERDKAKRAYEIEDRKYQLIKDVAENLTVGYNVGDTLMMKLKQTHDAKDAVYRRSVTFFETNESVFTTLDAIFASQRQLHVATQTQQGMIDGAGRAIETIAELSHNFEKAALKAGYGVTFNASLVQKLIDSVINYQTESTQLIGQYRKEATENARVIRDKTEEARQRLTQTITHYLPAPATAA
jgi:hypothetical protein